MTLCLAGYSKNELNKNDDKKWALSINTTQTAAFYIAKKVIKWNYTIFPLHLDGSYYLDDRWGLSLGLVYRYENYGKELKRPFGKTSPTELWTNYHELFALIGPRFSFLATGLRGPYAAIKAGPGFALSPGGYALTLVSQPELGYSFIFGHNMAFHLDLALGLMINIPLIEAPWMGYNYNALGWLVHRTTPIIRVGLGVAF